MDAFIGTSGWMYEWNKGASLEWYLKETGLNAIELNASFYRFPFPNQVKHWSSAGTGLSWAIKVNRLITHQYKLSKNSYGTFAKFLRLFKPLDKRIEYFLFQLPAFLTPAMMGNVERFLKKFDIAERFALEPRNGLWFTSHTIKMCKELGVTLVSVDAPFAQRVVNTSGRVYLRMHGRKEWYTYNYSAKELREVYGSVKKARPRKAHIFFNNDHSMLTNARAMYKLAGIGARKAHGGASATAKNKG